MGSAEIVFLFLMTPGYSVTYSESVSRGIFRIFTRVGVLGSYSICLLSRFCTAERTPVATVTTWVRVTGVQTGSAGARTHSWSAAFCTHFTLNLEGKQMI